MNIAVQGLLVIALLSSLGGWWFSTRKAIEKPLRVMLFVLYFWAFAFAQLILVGMGYWLAVI